MLLHFTVHFANVFVEAAHLLVVVLTSQLLFFQFFAEGR